jgi:hypothetical protein
VEFFLRVAALIVLLTILFPSSLRAQSVLDRRIGRDIHNAPLVMDRLGAIEFGQLAEAAGVPMGIESTPGPWHRPVAELKLTGLTLREALDEIQRRAHNLHVQTMAGPGYGYTMR